MNRLDNSGDSLDDFLGERTTSTKPAVSLPASYQPADYSEPCRKCGGSGRFRNFGPCFTCKGKGKLSFKTSPDARASSRASRAKSLAGKIEEFKAEYPDVWAWMDGSTFGPAVDMMAKLRVYGSLFDSSIEAARRMIANRDAKRAAIETAKVERVAAAPVIDMSKIEAGFATARANGLNKLKARFAGLTFAPARADSANAGAIYVRDGQEYLGKVVGGKFLAVRSCGAEREAMVLKVAADPKAAAIEYGRQTGTCSCCGRELSDPASVEAGIGPICATKWGW